MFTRISTLKFNSVVLGFLMLFGGGGVPLQSVNAADDTPIKIGFITSTSGYAAQISQDMVNGANLFLDQIHHQMSGRKVQLLVENDGSSPPMARTKFQKLAEQDKVQVIDGIVGSHIGTAVAPLAEHFKVPLVIAVAGADELTQRKRSNWVIRTNVSSSQPMYPFGEWVHNKLGYKRVVILAMDYSFGYGIVGGFQRSFEQAGGKIVQKVWAPVGFKDFEAPIKEIKKDADAVFLMTVGDAAEIIPMQYASLGPKLPIIGAESTFEETVLSQTGNATMGGISAGTYSRSLDNPANKRFVAAYQAKYHVQPSYHSECGYTSLMWIRKAVESVKGDVENKEKFLAALKAVELPDAPRGPMKLDSYGNPIENIYIFKVEKVGGKLQNVQIDEFNNVSQFYKWKPEEYMKEPAYSRDFPPCKYCSGK